MEANDNFYEIKDRFIAADLDMKIEIYTSVQGLSVEQYKELLSVFPIKHLDKLDKALV